MELQLDNNFILKIRFTKDDWTTVIISKEVNGEKSKDILNASYAAVLKYAIDCAILYPNQYINKSLDWPTETEIRPRTYKRVKSFLGKPRRSKRFLDSNKWNIYFPRFFKRDKIL